MIICIDMREIIPPSGFAFFDGETHRFLMFGGRHAWANWASFEQSFRLAISSHTFGKGISDVQVARRLEQFHRLLDHMIIHRDNREVLEHA